MMPRKDPITGCQVMTFHEFISAEAASEGKQPHELLEEMVQDIDNDIQNEEQRLKNNPDDSLKSFQEAAQFDIDEWESHKEGPKPPYPAKVVAVIGAKVQYNFRDSKTAVVADVEADDGQVHRVHFFSWSSSGSFYEPPDHEAHLQWDTQRTEPSFDAG